MSRTPKATKDKWKLAIELFYKLIESKKPKSTFTNRDIVNYINKNFNHGRTINLHSMSTITKTQLRYLIFKRSTANYTEYIFVRGSDKEIANQIRNFKYSQR